MTVDELLENLYALKPGLRVSVDGADYIDNVSPSLDGCSLHILTSPFGNITARDFIELLDDEFKTRDVYVMGGCLLSTIVIRQGVPCLVGS